MVKILKFNQRLKGLLDSAESKENVSPGSAIRMLPSEKELKQLAHLSRQLYALGERSRKKAVAAIVSGPCRTSELQL